MHVYVDVKLLTLQLQKMKEKKGLYPEKSVYTQQVGPGCCFGALALMLRFYFEVGYLPSGNSPLTSLHTSAQTCVLTADVFYFIC